jgi:hypothetical protein
MKDFKHHITRVSPDGVCITKECTALLGDRKNYCRECQKKRAEYFKRKRRGCE